MPAITRVLTAMTLAVILIAAASSASAANWPQYRFDATRAAISPEQLAFPLHAQWTYTPLDAPAPAWPEPGRELLRMPFDYAYHAVVWYGLVFFGSSADHTVRALNLSTGEELWRFVTGGPVRFAPAVSQGRVFAASDDGYLYALSVLDGELLWKFDCAPRQAMLMGNEQMVSRWPLRSGVALRDGIVYVSAGMWPAEGVYVYALRESDGEVLWVNDTSGRMYLPQPHPPSMSFTGVSPQGPMVVTPDSIYIPTGRNVPARFDPKTGELIHYHSRPNSWGNRWGGSWSFASEGLLFNWLAHVGGDINVMMGEPDPWEKDGIVVFDEFTGAMKKELFGKLQAILRDGILYASGTGHVTAYDLDEILGGKAPKDSVQWEVEHGRAYTMVMAGDALLLGGRGTVTALSIKDGSRLWSAEVGGQARGIAVSNGSILVSLDNGQIACFGAQDQEAAASVAEASTPAPQAPEQLTALVGNILGATGVTEGYCLNVNAGSCALARELARLSELRVWCLDEDKETVAQAREALVSEGLYGTRITVHAGTPDTSGYPKYFADLLVWGDGEGAPTASELGGLYRVLRPAGGVMCLVAESGGRARGLVRALRAAGVPGSEIARVGPMVQVTRGMLAGAGSWTHQYANAARTGASDDQIARLPMELLWFGKPGPAKLVARHWRGPAPLAINGKLFVIGQNTVTTVDSYNGREIWCRQIRAAGRFPVDAKGGSAAVDATSVYVATGKSCLRLDAETGETLMQYNLPPAPEGTDEKAAQGMIWSYLGVTDGTVIGTLGTDKAGALVAAIDAGSGAQLWTYVPEQSVHHSSIALGDGHVYLIDRPTAPQTAKLRRRGEKLSAAAQLVALDLRTGGELWRTDRGLTDRVELRLAKGTLLATGGGRMTAYSAKDGHMLAWSDVRMRGFPVVVGDTIYGEPHAFDLQTGKPKFRSHPLTGEDSPWVFSRSYGCGAVSGSPNLLMFRSSTLGMYDLLGDTGTHNWGGVRAGCYVNAIAANGLLLMPPSDASCTCSYSFQTTVALTPTDRNEDWAVFTDRNLGAKDRVKHMSVNFGAVGDRRAGDGTAWLSYPRPAGIKLPIKVEAKGDLAYDRIDSDAVTISGTDLPWVLGSNAQGELTITVNMGPGEPVPHTVRLLFAELGDAQPGDRVFDVKLQGETVAQGIDVAKSGVLKAVVREVNGVMVGDTLTVELTSAGSALPPILNGLQVLAE